MSSLCCRCGIEPQRKNKVWCSTCSKAYERQRWNNLPIEKRRAKWLKTKYKLSWEDYLQMYEAQNGLCSICKIGISIVDSSNSATTACVDHDHTTGQVRELLCNHCNRAVGLLKEDKNVVMTLFNYLEKWSG